MRTQAGAVFVLATLAGATTHAIERGAASKGVFVSPATGVAVGTVWGVFAGVSRHSDSRLSLKYAAADARALHGFYTSHLAGTVSEDQFRLLVDRDATRGKILKALREVLLRAFEGDLVILSFSMHGLPDDAGDLYFLPYDADPANLADNGISQADLLRLVQRSRARKVVLILDACHAGGFGQDERLVAFRSIDPSEVNRLLRGIADAQDGIAVLASSSANERSQESARFGGGHGAFTHCLLVALGGAGDADGDGLVGLRETFDESYRCVRQVTAGAQSPGIAGRFDAALPLARSRRAPPPRPAPVAPPGPSAEQIPAAAVDDLSGAYDDVAARVDAQNGARAGAWLAALRIAESDAYSRQARAATLRKFLADHPGRHAEGEDAENLLDIIERGPGRVTARVGIASVDYSDDDVSDDVGTPVVSASVGRAWGGWMPYVGGVFAEHALLFGPGLQYGRSRGLVRASLRIGPSIQHVSEKDNTDGKPSGEGIGAEIGAGVDAFFWSHGAVGVVAQLIVGTKWSGWYLAGGPTFTF